MIPDGYGARPSYVLMRVACEGKGGFLFLLWRCEGEWIQEFLGGLYKIVHCCTPIRCIVCMCLRLASASAFCSQPAAWNNIIRSATCQSNLEDVFCQECRVNNKSHSILLAAGY